jgi:hypothetical protein
MISEFKIGDHIKKAINDLIIDNTIYKIIDLKEVKSDNLLGVSIIATISSDSKPEIDEYRIQYTNNRCQIHSNFAIKLN